MTSGELHLPDLSRHRYVHAEKKPPLFQNQYQPDTRYIVPVNLAVLLWTILKHQNGKLESHVNKISDSDQPSFTTMSLDKWHWQKSTCLWNHVCHLCCSMLTSRENIPIQMQFMSDYIFIYNILLNCLWQPPPPRVARGLTDWWINNTEMPCNNLPITPNYQNLFAIDYCFWMDYHLN